MRKPFGNYVLVGALVIFGFRASNAQNAVHPRFDVASIKRNRDGTGASLDKRRVEGWSSTTMGF